MIYENVHIVSNDTGEVFESYLDGVIYVQTEKEKELARKHFKEKIPELPPGEVKFAPAKEYEKRGGFIWNIHDNAKILYPELRPASLTRLMFLATFLCYDGYLRDGRNPILRNTLGLYLNVGRREYFRFWSEMTSLGLMYEKDGKIYLNEDMFVKGSICKDKIRDLADKGVYITRIYSAAVRELYRSATPSSIKTLSYLFRILPYVNREYNICCFDPLETDIRALTPMTLGDFADVVGYDRSSASRLAKILHTPVFEIDGKQMNAMRYVAANDTKAETYGMFINPRIYYAGSDWSKVEVLCGFNSAT
ncbi:MAG: hypothetical protein RSB38_06235 [Oscillospiraceae bacterium]